MDGSKLDVYRVHEWFKPEFLTYECCRKCGIVRRADDKNSPCKGPVRVGPRALKAKGPGHAS